MDNHTRALGLMICLLALLQIQPVKVQTWSYTDGKILPRKTMNPVRLVSHPREVDLDGDGTIEQLVFDGKTVSIIRICNEGNQTRACDAVHLWESPPTWQVEQASITELNRDGYPEVTLLVWRPFSPWPIDQYIPSGGRINDFQTNNGMSSHLIMVGWKEGKFRELWAGSAMVRPFLSFISGDIDGDGFAELIGIESSYAESSTGFGRLLSVWEWNGFGFSRLSRIKGIFREVELAQTREADKVILSLN